jgi:integrase
MRRGEVAGLRWSDLDRATNRLSITGTLQSLAGQPVEFPVKTRTSRRCIDLDDDTMKVLLRWRRRLAREGLPHGIDDWMFLNTTGRFVNPESLSQLFDRLQGHLLELTCIRFHDVVPRPAGSGRPLHDLPRVRHDHVHHQHARPHRRPGRASNGPGDGQRRRPSRRHGVRRGSGP